VHDDHHRAQRVCGGSPRPYAGPRGRKDYDPWLRAEAGIELLKPAPNDLLQKWPVSKRVNSSRADDDDPTLIEEITLASATG
jgi:putative SOS response-associated peptidase YedK